MSGQGMIQERSHDAQADPSSHVGTYLGALGNVHGVDTTAQRVA
jgi:hypothetical protein